MRRNPYENRPGGARYRSQLDRIERLVTVTAALLLLLVVLAIVYLIRRL